MQDENYYEILQKLFKEAGITLDDFKNLHGGELDEFTKKLISNIVKQAMEPDFGDGFVVTKGINDPIPGTGYVRFAGEDIYIKDVQAFASMCQVANVIESFVEDDGRVVIELTFSRQ